MTKIALNDVSSLANEQSFITLYNSNNLEVETKSDTFLSRTGETPNEMEADLDMNSNRIINLPAPQVDTEPLRKKDLTDFVGGTLVLNANAQLYETRGIAVSAVVPGTTNFIMTAGYATRGDHGEALYKRVVALPTFGGFTSADGAKWALCGNYYTIEMFGAKGDGSTDDATAVQQAFAQHVTDGVILYGRKGATYKMASGQINMQGQDVNFDGRGCQFWCFSLPANAYLFTFKESANTTTTNLNATVTQGSRTITVANTAGSGDGKIVNLQGTNAATGFVYGMTARMIGAASGFNITLDRPIPSGFRYIQGTDTCTVIFAGASEGLHFRNCVIDGLNAGANGFGMLVTNCRYGTVENVKFTNWKGTGGTPTAGGFEMYTCADMHVRNMKDANCGTALRASFEVAYSSGITIDGVHSDFGGFGPQLSHCSYCTWTNMTSFLSSGRAFKSISCLHCNFSNMTISGATENGFSITTGTQFCNFNNITACGVFGVALNGNGIWLSDQTNQFNTISNFVSWNNQDHDIQVGASDKYNVFSNGQVGGGAATITTAMILDQGNNSYQNVNGHTWATHTDATLVNGDNHNLEQPLYGEYIRITGPTGAFAVTGVKAGFDGQRVILLNLSGQVMTIKENNTGSSAGNRILTLTGADVATTGGQSSVMMIYDITSAAWVWVGSAF